MSEKVEYPKFLFKPGAPDVIAPTFESHQTYAADGYLTAAEFDALPAVATPDVTGEERPVVETTDVVFKAQSAATACDLVDGESDVDVLREWRAAEESRTGGPRKTVLRALEDKLGDSAAADQIGAAGE